MDLKQKLDYHYKVFDKSKISPDPLQFLHLYKDEKDIEIIGFISSIFAYGNVKQIINTLNSITIMGNIRMFILSLDKKLSKKYFGKTIHRFYTPERHSEIVLCFKYYFEKRRFIKKFVFKILSGTSR